MQDTMRDRFVGVTTRLLDDEPRLAIVLAVIGLRLFRDSGAADRHPDRVIDVGIREQMMIGTAAGMALEGMRPIAHSYGPFLVERPFEQIKLDFAYQGVGGILVSVGATHDWAEGGWSHMAPADVALIGTLPGWEILVPGHADEVEQMLRRSAGEDGRTYLRLSEFSNGAPHPAGDGRVVPIRSGSAGAPLVLAVGPMLDRTLAAVADLDVTVAYTATVRPLDAAGLQAVMGGREVVVVEPYLAGSSTSRVAEALLHRPHRLLSIGTGTDELRNYGRPEEHDAAWGIDEAGIRRRIVEFLDDPAPLRIRI